MNGENNEELKIRTIAFNEVRDIPYHVAVVGEADWCCATKTALLQRRLASLGLGSRFAFGTYDWAELNLPAEMLAILPEQIGWHQWLSVFVPETDSWVDVDPSWDSGLRSIFSIAEWDGLNSTKLAVPVTQRCSEDESRQIVAAGYEYPKVAEYMKANRPFLKALNNYLSRSRFPE